MVMQDEIQRLGPSVDAMSNDGVMEAVLGQVRTEDDLMPCTGMTLLCCLSTLLPCFPAACSKIVLVCHSHSVCSMSRHKSTTWTVCKSVC